MQSTARYGLQILRKEGAGQIKHSTGTQSPEHSQLSKNKEKPPDARKEQKEAWA